MLIDIFDLNKKSHDFCQPGMYEPWFTFDTCAIYIFDEKYVDRLTVIIILITHPNHMID